MQAMTRPRKKASDDKPADVKPADVRRPNRTGVPLHIYVHTEIDQALQEYLESTEPRVPKTAAVESALRAFLAERGFWPRKEGGGA